MAPFVLKFKGNKSFSPLGQISDADTLTRTWKVCTKVASHLEQGQRLENLSWRLWFLQIALVQADNAKQKREFKKFSKGMSDKLDKDKGRSIHELQAPNFKRTDSTDKVRLRVEEMATHRENGTLPTSGSSRFGADGSNNYMKGMQYTFAVDPRVKPIATTTATSTNNANGANGAEGGKSMMGKMRVRPMHPPPVPPGRFKAEVGKDGDTTMHGNANNAPAGSRNEHAMDVSDDHSHANLHDHGDTKMHEDSGIASSTADPAEHGDHANEQQQDSDTYFDSEEGAGHHTPTPQHLLPSHHPSALPYPPTTANPQVLSNALSSSTGHFGSQSNYGSSNNSNTTSAGGVARPAQSHIVRFPTIFSSDFGPTSLLCALPVSNPGASPTFSFETSPQDIGNGYQNFSALGPNAERSITTQGIYGPSGPPAVMGYPTTATAAHTTRMVNPSATATTFSAAGMNGIGVGMQHASTPFDFGVPRPTFEFPIEEILKGDMGDDELGAGGALGENAGGASEITPWDANNVNMNLNLAAGVDGMFGLGGLGATGHWGVPPSEIHNPNGANSVASANSTTPTSPTKRGFHGSVGATPILSRQNSTPATVAYGTLVSPANAAGGNAGNKDVVSAGQMQTGQVNAKANNTSPASVHSNTSNSMGGVKGESAYDGSVASQTSPATPSTAGGSAATGSSGSNAGSVVPGNVGNTAPGGVKSECANCGATHTPLWRRGLNDELNCNACGLYCKLHKRARPKNLRTTHGDRAGNAWGNKAGEAELAGEPVQCHNCATTATPLWRKDDEGNTLCNACGLYLKLHGTRRPLSMKSDVIRKRSRHETEKRTSVSSIITVMTPTNNNPQNSRRNSPTPPPSAGSNSSGPEPFTNPALGANGVDSMGFSFGQNFSQDYSYNSDSDYMSGIGMGMGDDLTTFSSFGSYGVFNDSTSNTSMSNPAGLASPTSPTEVQHIVETTIMTGVENGGGHVAPNAKRRRMTLDSNFSGSSVAHTTGGSNSAHSSPTGIAVKGSGNSPPYFSLDATLNGSNNVSGSTNNTVDQNGAASPTRSLFGAGSPGQSFQTMSGVAYDYYGYPIHPPMAPLHPPSLMHPHSLTWGDNQLQHTPTQSSMSQAHSMSRSPSHSRNASHSHSRSRSGSQHITMPLYLYDGGASSRIYEGANAATPTATGTTNPTDEEIFNSGFDLFDHSSADDSNRMHYGPAAL